MAPNIEVVESGLCLWLLLPDGKVEQEDGDGGKNMPPPPLRSMIATTFTPKPPISGSSPSVHPALTIERWCRPRRCTWVPPNQLTASSLFKSCALHSLIHFDVDEVLILNNHECRNVEHTS